MASPKCPRCGKRMISQMMWIGPRQVLEYHCLRCQYKLPKPTKTRKRRKETK